ncbi:MAG TPA: OsmC family protein [Cyclobacteriaceae bacterium]|nr:OsmC family protein [Cyclobacteriaceae bacterium]
MIDISCQWQSKMTFQAEIDGHSLTLDASPKGGGEDKGPRPKSLLLGGLAGCTGMDVVSLLNKMRVAFSDFKIKVSGDITDEHPRIFKKIHISYFITGRDIDKSKVEKAVQLSQEKYCGVAAMMRPVSEISFDIQVIEEQILV